MVGSPPGSAKGSDADYNLITERLERRLVGDMVKTHPRRVKDSDKIEAWLADEIRDAIALIRRQALRLRGLDEEKAQLLEQLEGARKKIQTLEADQSRSASHDSKMVRAKK
jgi:hypothetical protein